MNMCRAGLTALHAEHVVHSSKSSDRVDCSDGSDLQPEGSVLELRRNVGEQREDEPACAAD